MRTYAFALLAALSAAGQNTTAPKPDNCTPPPGSIAPSLPAKLMEGQGSVHFPITTRSTEAQKFFNQGVAQMHSFWSREAERSFLQAAALDPEAPMPQWGVAMVATGDYRPRFQLDNPRMTQQRPPEKSRALTAARKAVELAKVPGKATELEQMYVASIMARRNPATKTPDDDYIRGLRAIAAKYPNEVEAKSYLALHLMRGFVLPGKQPRHEGSTEAVAILRELLQKAPDHAGVHHYVIHGWEGSTFATDAWPSCKRYAELAPNIPHALHMPGHIYSQTGRWGDAIASFDAAAVNERGYMRADSLYANQHHGHNVHYLATSYSFNGDYDKAIAASRELLGLKETPREAKQNDNFYTAYMQGWFGTMRALVQFHRWDDIVKGEMLPEPTKPRQAAWYHWARGVAKANLRDIEGARREARRLNEAFARYKREVKRNVPDELRVAQKELEAQMLIAEGKLDKGLKRFESASAAERHLRYVEPPNYPRPVAEAMGQVAAKHGRTAVAERAFKTALEQFPADHHAQSGLRALAGESRTAGL